MKDSITMNRTELERLIKILDRFDVKYFTLTSPKEKNGIGTVIDVEFDAQVDQYSVKHIISVSSHEDW